MSTIGMNYDEIISKANGMSEDVQAYMGNLKVIYDKLEEARGMWKGIDNNEFTDQVIASKPKLVSIGQSVEDHATFLRKDASDRMRLQNDIAGEARSKLGE